MKMFTLILIAAVAGYVGGTVTQPTPTTAAEQKQQGYTLDSLGTTGGVWVQDANSPNTAPVGGFYSTRLGGKPSAVLSFMCSPQSRGAEFAISSDKDGVTFQVVDDKGEVHFVPATALLKLIEKK